MPTPTALIADDEEAPRAQLQTALRTAWPELQVVQECANGIDAWDAFLEHEPQVCFLDVRMPGLTGIEVAQRIGGGAHVVFVAVSGDHVLSAFEAGPADHVLKPIDAERLGQVVVQVETRLAAPGGAPADLRQLLARLVGQVRRPAPLEAIQAGVGMESRLVRLDDVVYFESEGRSTRVVHAEAAGTGEVLIRTPLKELLAQLDPARFWQVHRSVIVNPLHIASALRVDEANMVLTLNGRDERLPVARHFQGLFPAS